MSFLVVRHGLSEANNRENFGTPAFGHPDAPLMDLGKQQALQMGLNLKAYYGIDTNTAAVATSSMRRTQETAIAAGFRHLNIYKSLNEVASDLRIEEIENIRQTRQLPKSILQTAEHTLNNPPCEKIWVSHALRIAAMCKVLDIYQSSGDRLLPHFCEIRELPI